jgi:hypothetical protein
VPAAAARRMCTQRNNGTCQRQHVLFKKRRKPPSIGAVPMHDLPVLDLTEPPPPALLVSVPDSQWCPSPCNESYSRIMACIIACDSRAHGGRTRLQHSLQLYNRSGDVEVGDMDKCRVLFVAREQWG